MSRSSNKPSLPDDKPSLTHSPPVIARNVVTKQSSAIANSVFALSVFCLTFLIAFISGTTFLSISDSSAKSKGIGITATLDSTIAITTNAVNDELILDITPTPSGAQTVADITVTVSTNNSTGYILTLNSTSDSTTPLVPLVNETDSGQYVESTTNTWGSAAALANNTWGVSVWTTGQSTSSTTFSSVPRLTTPQEIRKTEEAHTASATTLSFAAKVDNTKKSGVYTNTVVFTATANAAPIRPYIASISPTTNWTGGDIYITGTNLPTTTSGTTITVGGTPCQSFRLVSDTLAICVLPARPNNTTNVVVVARSGQTSNTNRTVVYDDTNKGKMQEFDTTTCSNMPMGLAQIWADHRNNAVYRIKKMIDNKCWMIDNLAYPGENPAKPGFNNDDSPSNNYYGDAQTLTFATACGGDNWDTAEVKNCNGPTSWPNNSNTRQVTTNNFTGSNLTDRMGNNIQNTEGNLYSTGNVAPCADSLTGSGNMSGVCISYLYNGCAAIGLDSSTNPTCNEVRSDSTVDDSNGSTSGGNVNTGMADTGIVGKPSGIGGESKGNSNAANQAGLATSNGSICPAGWRLPVGQVNNGDNAVNTNNEFAVLNGAMSSAGASLSPNTTGSNANTANFVSTGSFSVVGSGLFNLTNALLGQSYYAYLWSSSMYSSEVATAWIYSTNVYPGTYNQAKVRGVAVRCVLN